MDNDLIGRSALKEELEKYRFAVVGFEGILFIIDNAPIVDVETQLLGAKLHGIKLGYEEAQKKLIRPQGEWVKVVNKISECETETHWECSECHNPDFRLGEAEFCSFCGASMKGGAE